MPNDFSAELLNLKPWITLKAPAGVEEISKVLVSTFSDAAFNQTTSSGYGQRGVLMGLRIHLKNGVDLFHALDSVSNKQCRVSYSPYGAEILACTDGDDRGFFLKSGLKSIFSSTTTLNVLFTASRVGTLGYDQLYRECVIVSIRRNWTLRVGYLARLIQLIRSRNATRTPPSYSMNWFLLVWGV